MKFNEYQEKALATAIYPREAGLIYPALKLAGEAGEVAEKVGKLIRDKGYRPWKDTEDGIPERWARIPFEQAQDIAKELGDVLWYVAACCDEIGIDLEWVSEMNLAKLASRQERGVIQGSGDER